MDYVLIVLIYLNEGIAPISSISLTLLHYFYLLFLKVKNNHLSGIVYMRKCIHRIYIESKDIYVLVCECIIVNL